MNGVKRIRLGFAGAAVAVLAGGLFLVMSAWAASGSLTVTDGTAEPGETGDVELISDVEEPGLGAWTADITYDNTVVTAVGCTEAAGSVCNPDFADDTVRVTGASATGHEGETLLATISFQCGDEEADSPLTLSVEVFSDATIGDPQPIEPAEFNDGTFTCEVAPDPTPTETPDVVDEDPTPTTAPDLPPTGTGSATGGSGSLGWVIVALSAVALAGIAGFGAMRLRTR